MGLDRLFDTLKILESLVTISAQWKCEISIHSTNSVYSDTWTRITLTKEDYLWSFGLGKETSSFYVIKNNERLCSFSFDSKLLASGVLQYLLILAMFFYTEDSTNVLLSKSKSEVPYISENSLRHIVPEDKVTPLVHKLRQRWETDVTYDTLEASFLSLVDVLSGSVAQ